MNTADSAWLKELTGTLKDGKACEPRGIACLERIGALSIVNMNRPVISIATRKLNYRFMAAEAYWILSGDSSTAGIRPYCKNILEFSDDGYHFAGAYGPKVMEQMRYAVRCLLRDRDTRQAVISIWRENPPYSKDIPCTLTMQFLWRSNSLHALVNMRSNDLWLGWPYDVFNFSMITYYICLRLKQQERIVFPGMLYLYAGSSHLYKRNEDQAINICNHRDIRDYKAINTYNYNNPDDLMNGLDCLRSRDYDTTKLTLLPEIATWT